MARSLPFTTGNTSGRTIFKTDPTNNIRFYRVRSERSTFENKWGLGDSVYSGRKSIVEVWGEVSRPRALPYYKQSRSNSLKETTNRDCGLIVHRGVGRRGVGVIVNKGVASRKFCTPRDLGEER